MIGIVLIVIGMFWFFLAVIRAFRIVDELRVSSEIQYELWKITPRDRYRAIIFWASLFLLSITIGILIIRIAA